MGRPLLRIAIHGCITALVLGTIGLVFAEFASMWLSTNPVPGATADLDRGSIDRVRTRVPMMMAFWGFVVVALGEALTQAMRRKGADVRPPTAQPDETEKLLEELLAQAEAKAAREAHHLASAGDDRHNTSPTVHEPAASTGAGPG